MLTCYSKGYKIQNMVKKQAVVTDSNASPFIVQKDVILCRSGIQFYTYNEVVQNTGREPPIKKDIYREYRPANVLVKAQKLCRSLPVTKEHPEQWVNQDNWKELVGGVLDRDVSVVALEGEAEGEIGLKSNITFYTRELYDYYTENKEVSLGYECCKHFVDNPEEVGYDIVLDEIKVVNHLAITRAGRGGSSVAVIDSIIGGLKPMRTGIFAWLKSKKQEDSSVSSFGKLVLDSVKNSKGTTEEEITLEMGKVLDSLAFLKDCDTKNTLVDVVKDCFSNKEKTIENKEVLIATLDSMFIKAQNDSVANIESFLTSETKTEDSDEKKEDEEKVEDSDEKKEDEKKVEDSEEKKEDEEEVEDSDEKKEEDCGIVDNDKENSSVKDSIASMTKDDLLSVVKENLAPMVTDVVKEVLGIKENKSEVSGFAVDSKTSGIRDYSSFLN